jgi:hypothetical protein
VLGSGRFGRPDGIFGPAGVISLDEPEDFIGEYEHLWFRIGEKMASEPMIEIMERMIAHYLDGQSDRRRKGQGILLERTEGSAPQAGHAAVLRHSFVALQFGTLSLPHA